MPVLREWRAEIPNVLRDEYVRYIKTEWLPAYERVEGNLGAIVAVRDLDPQRSEIVTLSWWTDSEAIKAFAGPDIDRARYSPEDDRFLLTRPMHVHHYEANTPR